jgi:hypothetical protein
MAFCLNVAVFTVYYWFFDNLFQVLLRKFHDKDLIAASFSNMAFYNSDKWLCCSEFFLLFWIDKYSYNHLVFLLRFIQPILSFISPPTTD